MRDLIVVILGFVLCVILMAVGTYVALRTTSVGQLLIDTESARSDPAALSAALTRYGDPFGLLTETFPRLLNVLGLLISVLVGGFVGIFVSRERPWMSVVSVLPLAATTLLAQPTSPGSWLLASVCVGLALIATNIAVKVRYR